MVNPHHVHKTKELDDNSPSKNDRKDPRVIAGLVRDGRYFYSYMPTGVYAELRNASNRRFVLVEEQTRVRTVCRNGLQCISKNIREFIHT